MSILTYTYQTEIPDNLNPLFPLGYDDQESVEAICVDWQRRQYYSAISGEQLDGSFRGGVEVTNIDSMDVLQTPFISPMFTGTFFGRTPGVAPSETVTGYVCNPLGGNLYLNLQTIAPFQSALYKINPATMKVTGQYDPGGEFGSSNPVACSSTQSFEIVALQTSSIELPNAALFINGTWMTPIGFGPNAPYLQETENFPIVVGKVPGDGTCQFIQVNSDSFGTSGNIDIFVISFNDVPDISWTQTGSMNVSDLLGAGTNTFIQTMEYDATNDCILLGIATYVDTTPILMSVNYDGSRRWVYGPCANGITQSYGRSQLKANTFGFGSGDGGFTVLNTSNAAVIFQGIITPPPPPDFVGSFYRIWDAVDLYYFTFALAVNAIRLNFSYGPPNVIAPPPQYLHFLTCCDRAIMAHLYQFTSATGEQDYFTDFDVSIFYNNITWKANSLRFEGLQRKLGIGTSVDEQNLKIWSSPTDTLFGANFLTGAEEGLLDGAVIVRQRIIWEFVSGNVAQDITNPPLFVFTLFTGYTSAISKGGVSHVELKVKSALLKLNVNMPRNYWQPGCLWTLFDQGCGLPKAEYGANFTITGANPSQIAVASGAVQPSIAADGIQNYASGRLLFTSGVNAGLQVLIDSNDASNFYLAYPLDQVPNIGDLITVYPGCSKSYNTCLQKFNNVQNFRGFDKVPPVFISM